MGIYNIFVRVMTRTKILHPTTLLRSYFFSIAAIYANNTLGYKKFLFGGDALTVHTFKQLRQVPDLNVGCRFAIFKVGGSILQAQRTLP